MAVLPEAMVELGPQRGVRLSEEKISSKGCSKLGSFVFYRQNKLSQVLTFLVGYKGGVTLVNTTLNCTKL